MFKKYGNGIFWFFTSLHVLSIYLQFDQIRFISKLFLIPVLIIYLIAQDKPIHKMAYAALAASFFGDAFLTREGTWFFLLGMAAFLITHILNSIYFFTIKNGQKETDLLTIKIATPLLFIAGLLCYFLIPHLGNLLVPILIYVLIICLMSILATQSAANKQIRTISLQWFIPGALFFIGSDAILALNKFIFHNTILDVLVMLTYALAQYYLVQGYRLIAKNEHG